MTARPDPQLFTWLSFDPERRANFEASALAGRCAEIEARAADLSARPGARAIPADLVAELITRHERATRAYWAAEGRCASPMITGPANFPTDRNRKRCDTADKRRREVVDHLAAAKRRLERYAFPHGMGDAIRSAGPEALDNLRAELADAEAEHERKKAANAILRKHGASRAHLEAAGLPEQLIKSALVCNHAGQPYGFFTNNSNARIARIRDRIKSLEAMKARGTVERDGPNGVRVVENAEAARIQLFYPGKPDAEIRAKLKENGFRWAPSEGAWQRHLNNAGRYAADRVLGATERPAAPKPATVGERWKGTGPRITAIFEADGDANAYMAARPGQGVLAVEGGLILIADCSDLGA
jgi:hypothetical protein